MAILEAAYRIGQDGNGKNGVAGYFLWLGGRHPGIFYTVLLCRPIAVRIGRKHHARGAAPDNRRTRRIGSRTISSVKGKNRMKGQTDQVAVPVDRGLDRPGLSRWRSHATRHRGSESFLQAVCCGVSAAANQAPPTSGTEQLVAANGSSVSELANPMMLVCMTDRGRTDLQRTVEKPPLLRTTLWKSGQFIDENGAGPGVRQPKKG